MWYGEVQVPLAIIIMVTGGVHHHLLWTIVIFGDKSLMTLTIVIFNDGPLMTVIIDAYMEMVKDHHHIQWTIVMYGDGLLINLTIDIIVIII